MIATTAYTTAPELAKELDATDDLRRFREEFIFPKQENGQPFVYLCGNSLGLQPKGAAAAVQEEMDNWSQLGVEGHFHAKRPWTEYHEFLTEAMARVVGAKPIEVVVMNTLTVNLHFMLVSFYRPNQRRRKILIEADAFPSDKFAVTSQLQFHGLDSAECMVELAARPGEVLLRNEDIRAKIEELGDELALVMLGTTNYYTGQRFDLKAITEWGHSVGATVGFDCAHGAGNVPLDLHDTNCDFALWCNYKYLNGGPGTLGGVFVNERYANDRALPRFTGWWGHELKTRFIMEDEFIPTPGAEGWQMSNPPILSLAAFRAALEVFDEAGIDALRAKSLRLTAYLEFLVGQLGEDVVRVITPSDPEQRGCQLSIQVKAADKALFDRITERGVIADWREPDVIRIAPAPLYNSFQDVHAFYSILKAVLEEG
jgi:kynureninase